DLESPGPNPLDELSDSGLRLVVVLGAVTLLEDRVGNLFFYLRMGEFEFALFLRAPQRVKGCAIGLQADENTDLLDALQGRVEAVKPSREEITDETVKKPGVLPQKRVEPVTKRVPRFVGEEGEVS